MPSIPATSVDDVADRVLSVLEALLPGQRPLPLHAPQFDARATRLVTDCLESGWVSSVGAHVDGFEQALSEYTGLPHAVATVNGTAALHLCLLLAGVQAGDEVLLPALTFVGTANPVAAMGAVPHFVDADPDTLGVDPVALDDYLKQHTLQRDGVCINRDTGRPMRALIVVHILGHIGDMEALRALAERHHLKLIEDAAEALGSWRDGRHAGSWGHVAALSFNGNKIITTGGGGAVLSQDPELARRARHLSTTAKQPHPWRFSHDEVGFNYRMPNLNAALGLAQLARLDEFVKAKRALARRYQIAFSQVEGVSCFQEPARDHSNYWLNLLLLDDAGQRDALLQRAHAAGLQLRPFWTPLDQLPMYRDAPSMPLSISTRLFEHGICLPSSPALNMTQEVVCATSW